MFEVNNMQFEKDVIFQTCRASGAGGQHVNTTDSAVQATHRENGITARVESEHSQHANKRAAFDFDSGKIKLIFEDFPSGNSIDLQRYGVQPLVSFGQ